MSRDAAPPPRRSRSSTSPPATLLSPRSSLPGLLAGSATGGSAAAARPQPPSSSPRPAVLADHHQELLRVDLGPAVTSTSSTTPSRSAKTPVSIFIASIDSSRSPRVTLALVGRDRHDQARHRCGDMGRVGVVGHALGRPARGEGVVGHLHLARLGAGSKKIVRWPCSSASPTARKRITRVLPRSMSTNSSVA